MSALHSRDCKNGLRNWLYLNLSKLFKSEKFQLWAANIPVISWFARAEGEAIFDLVMGFVSAQVLWALVELPPFLRFIRLGHYSSMGSK